MGIEFAVKMVSAPSTREVAANLSRFCIALFGRRTTGISFQDVPGRTLGRARGSFACCWNSTVCAEVWTSNYRFERMPPSVESGWWMDVSRDRRHGARGLLFALMFTTCVAELACFPVVDEWCILRAGRFVSPSYVRSFVDSLLLTAPADPARAFSDYMSNTVHMRPAE